MCIRRQTAWGWLVLLDIFIGGIGAGIYPISFILVLFNSMKEMATIGALLGPIFVILGLIFLLLELGAPIKAYRVYSGLSTSWMSRGALIQIFYIIFGLGYAIPTFWLPLWPRSGFGLAVGVIALILALIISIYHGLLLSQARAIPIWSSSVLPVVFFTALCSGLGIMLIMVLVFSNLYGYVEIIETFTVLGISGIVFIVGELIALWSLLSSRLCITYTESVKVLRAPIILAIICLLFSLVFLASGLWAGKGIDLLIRVSVISGILLLVAGFIVRYSTVRAGHFYSLQIPLAR